MNLYSLFIISFFLISFLYLCMILIFYFGWKRVFSFEPKGSDQLETKISVVVACKNEKDNILTFIASVAQQSYKNFELILVNDHSTDSTKFLIESTKANFPNLILIDAVGHGKKNALKEGILASSYDLIVTTDADCIPSYHWLESIASYQKRFDNDLLICPVGISDGYTLFSRLQSLEFVSLVGAAAGTAGFHMPILCNGANLAFKKKVWLASRNHLYNSEQSGDDMFLLESVKRQNGTVSFLKSEAAFVKTKAAKDFKGFVRQRQRWAGKSKLYTDWQIILTALIVLAMSLLCITMIGLSFYNIKYLDGYIALFAFKAILDIRFLYLVRRFFELQSIWSYALLLSVIYPFYIVYISLSSLFVKPKWK